jgi:hypothetical protein
MIIMMRIAIMFLSEENDDDHMVKNFTMNTMKNVMMMITSEYSV